MFYIKFKKIISVILLLCLLIGFPSFAKEENEQYADALNAVGLFGGTGSGYELSRAPTRAEALVMLIRLLGEEKTALSQKNSHPFKDGLWADAYIGYAYKNNLVKGMSETEFGTNLPITNTQFATLLMRAMGYSDDKGGQFSYEDAYEFALHKLSAEKDAEFNRGVLAKLCYQALNTPLAFSEKTLAQTLMSKRVFTQGEFAKANSKIQKEPVKTAVLIYAVASDLESKLGMFSMDIDEIINATPKGIDILVQTGGTQGYINESLKDGETQRFSLTDGKLTVLENLGSIKMCEKQTLTDFLKFATKKSDADRYVLVFWDHGEGTIGGFGRDELNSNAALSLSDMKEALADAGEKFDIVVFDACLMGTAETAYALKDSAEYMIASEDIVPNDGLYYTTWLKSLSVNNSLSTEGLAKMIVDAYVVHAPPGREDVNLSVIRLGNIEKTVGIIGKEIKKLSEDKELIRRLEALSPKPFGPNNGNDQYDILSLFGGIDMDISALNVAIESAVYYKRSAVSKKYSGLAFYLPLTRMSEFEKVKKDLLKIRYPESIVEALGKLN